MSDANTNATGSQDAGHLTSSPIMSSITAPVVHGGLRDGDSQDLVTTLADTANDNRNRQAEYSNRSIPGTARNSVLQRRGTRALPRIFTSLRGAATDRQELGPNNLATGNNMQVLSTPMHGYNNPTSFGMPQTNHHRTTLLSHQSADNIQNRGISSADNFSHSSEPVNEQSHPMERSTLSEATATPSNLPSAEGIDNGVPSRDIVLLDLPHDLDELPRASDNEVRGDGNALAQGNLAPPTNEVAAMNIANSRPNTPVTPADGSLASSQTSPVPNSPIASGRVVEAALHNGSGNERVLALDAMESGAGGHLDPLFEERPSYAALVESSTPDSQTEPAAGEPASELSRPTGHSTLYDITVTQNVSVTVMDLNQGVERSSSNGDTLNMDHVHGNALEGRGYSIGVDNNHDRRAPGLVGSLRRMSQEEVQEFWGEIDGSGNNGESR